MGSPSFHLSFSIKGYTFLSLSLIIEKKKKMIGFVLTDEKHKHFCKQILLGQNSPSSPTWNSSTQSPHGSLLVPSPNLAQLYRNFSSSAQVQVHRTLISQHFDQKPIKNFLKKSPTMLTLLTKTALRLVLEFTEFEGKESRETSGFGVVKLVIVIVLLRELLVLTWVVIILVLLIKEDQEGIISWLWLKDVKWKTKRTRRKVVSVRKVVEQLKAETMVWESVLFPLPYSFFKI